MNDMGKMLVLIGLAIAILGGLIWWATQNNLPLGRLPGDIRIERDNFKFYFPLTTCLLISAVLTLVIWLLRKW
jgi:hypothetical protein